MGKPRVTERTRRTYTFRHDRMWRLPVARNGKARVVFAAVYPDCVRAAWTNPSLEPPIVRGFFLTTRNIVAEPYTEMLWVDGVRLLGEKDADGNWFVVADGYRRILELETPSKTFRHAKLRD